MSCILSECSYKEKRLYSLTPKQQKKTKQVAYWSVFGVAQQDITVVGQLTPSEVADEKVRSTIQKPITNNKEIQQKTVSVDSNSIDSDKVRTKEKKKKKKHKHVLVKL